MISIIRLMIIESKSIGCDRARQGRIGQDGAGNKRTGRAGGALALPGGNDPGHLNNRPEMTTRRKS